MKLNNLYFHIHYCNARQSTSADDRPIRLQRTLSHHELIYIAEAKGTFTIGGKTHKLRSGMLLYIRPGAPHAIETVPGTAGRFYSVHFSFGRVDIGEDGWGIREEVQPLPLQAAQTLADSYQVEDSFRRLAETWLAKLPGYEFLSAALLQQLLVAIALKLKKADRRFAASHKIERIIRYMQDHLQDKLTLGQLAEQAQWSPTYLSRTFRDITGCTVIEYINKLKMDKAKEMMLMGGKKVKEVAKALGYADEFYFSRVFKRSEGMSPSEYYSKIVHGV
ncbi:helix-turn-helix transcriptional regulator [Cohnella fermenti]|uniref:AraC family transcriptional regulator n=1 Tax=Cohnella fermenti TaxID=2565925 RepID=A0A4S4C3L0_9BACL|nr:AraC family transcriptional regulator [Cohnella fermenti]THF82240.1 AraC family transcriptional regulator [Cohnella fermenti]